ncbi:MAG: hydrolase [Frankiales bacterium]|nr:hydrolase [Frankiales bacterium]
MLGDMTSPDPPAVPVPCVGGIVQRADGAFLLIRRGTEPGRGRWSIPGGRVEAGERPLSAVAREVLEETGVQVRVGRPVGTVERPGAPGATYVITDYLCAPVDSEPLLQPGDDADAAAWVPAGDVASYDLVDGLLDALRGWGFRV